MVRDPPLPEGGGVVWDPPPSWHLGAKRQKFFFAFGAQRRKKIFPSARSAGNFFFGFSDICEREEGGGLDPP